MTTIACFGDSLIQGFPYGNETSWIARVAEKTGFTMLNYGICGECCDDIFDRLKRWPLPEGVEHILFFGGMNDIMEGKTTHFIIEDLKRVNLWCREKGYRLCIVLPWLCAEPELNPAIHALREEILRNFGEGCYLLDFQPMFPEITLLRSQMFLDGVHPSSATYEGLGDYAAPKLAEWGKTQ